VTREATMIKAIMRKMIVTKDLIGIMANFCLNGGKTILRESRKPKKNI
jgi:hypothetical protein